MPRVNAKGNVESISQQIRTETMLDDRGVAQQLLTLRPAAFAREIFTISAAFCATCIYLLLEYVRPQSIYAALSYVPFARIFLVSAAILAAFEANKTRRVVYGSCFPLLMSFFVVAVVSMLLSRYPTAGWDFLLVIASWYVAIFAISRSVNTEAKFIAFYILFMLFSFKMSQHGFRVWATHGFTFIKTGVSGAPGWFQNSGEVGVQMCVFFPMLIHFCLAGWKHWSLTLKVIAAFVALTVVGTVVGSSSRGAVIGLAAAGVWMLLRGNRNRFAISFVGLVLAFSVYKFTPAEFVQRFQEIGSDSDSQNRLRFWSFGWEYAKSHPVFGMGLGNWMPVYSRYLNSIGSINIPQLPHNIFVQALAEMGFVGLILVLMIVFTSFRLNRKSRKLAEQHDRDFLRHASLGLDAGMIGYLVSGQFVSVLYYPYLWIGLAMSIALHNSVTRIAEAAGRPDQTRTLRGPITTEDLAVGAP